jgi:hypothetical protein
VLFYQTTSLPYMDVQEVGREEGEREVLLLECNSNIRVQDSTACIHILASCVPYPFPRLHLGRLGHVGEKIRVFLEEDL